jgi:hypothetical protein
MRSRLDKYIKYANTDIQLSTLDHISYNKGESVMAEGKESTSLIEDGPYMLGNDILHVFPPVHTSNVIAVLL